jgi:hypothetical protein
MKTGLYKLTPAQAKKLGVEDLDQGSVLIHMSDKSPKRLNKYADLARDMVLGDEECEIDEHPIYSEAEDGVWVSAWLWVCK